MILICILVCLGSTLLGAVSGIGGGVIIKPVLDAVLPLGMAKVSLISSFAVFFMSLFSVAKHYLKRDKRGAEDFQLKYAAWLAVGAVFGGLLGKVLFSFVSERLASNGDLVKCVQNGILLILMTTVLVFGFLSRKPALDSPARGAAGGLPIGFILGIAAAFLGIGGGPLNMLALTVYYRMPYKRAALYSLFVILCSQGAAILTAAFASDASEIFDAPFLAAACAAGVLGGVLGRMLAGKLRERTVRLFYQGALVFIIAMCAFNIITSL